jgi:hypothetical protein
MFNFLGCETGDHSQYGFDALDFCQRKGNGRKDVQSSRKKVYIWLYKKFCIKDFVFIHLTNVD